MLSKKAQYAIYALKHLAEKFGEGPVLIGKIAEAENIPHKFLEGILLELRNKAIVNSRKGKKGGYYLVRKPETVALVEIIRGIDGPIALLPCASVHFYEPCSSCKDEATCAIKQVMQEVRDKTNEILSNNTLADLVQREKDLKEDEKSKHY